MAEIFLSIPGKPVAKKTHRTSLSVNWKNKTWKTWTRFPQRIEADDLSDWMRTQYDGPVIEYGVSISFEFYMPIPKRWRKDLKEQARKGILHHVSKPDASNLAKYYEDCMRGVILKDDCQAVWITPVKLFAVNDDPHTEILIRPFNYEDYSLFRQTFGRGARLTSDKVA